jgi:hypothetical protein
VEIVLILTLTTSVAGYSQTPAPPNDIMTFFHEIMGEWIGTVEEYTSGVKADTKYFHAVNKQTSLDTYESVFEYYRIDKNTHAPVQIGLTKMTNRIASDGVATNTITGKGDVFINPKTSKPEEHTLSEVLRMSHPGSLEGKGSGKISVAGLALGAGKNGKVSDYTSVWVLNNDILSITEQLKVTFHVFLFAKRFEVVDKLEAKRGSDVMGLMSNAGGVPDPGKANSKKR